MACSFPSQAHSDSVSQKIWSQYYQNYMMKNEFSAAQSEPAQVLSQLSGSTLPQSGPNLQPSQLAIQQLHITRRRNSTDSQDLRQDEIDLKPSKYRGYRKYSEFIASDDDFFILRRFGAISARIALSLQDQVAILEERLIVLDKKYDRRDSVDVKNGAFREDQGDRIVVLKEMEEALTKYSKSAPSSISTRYRGLQLKMLSFFSKLH